MLTQRAFNDYTWCPTLLKESEGAEKRVASDRSVDPTAESVLRSLRTFQSDPRVLCYRYTRDVFRIEAHESKDHTDRDLWIVANTPVTPVLMALRHIDHHVGSKQKVEFHRVLWKKPFGSKEEETEMMLRRILWCSFSIFIQGQLSITSTYPDCPDPAITTHVTPAEARDAYRLVAKIHAILERDLEPSRTIEHCRCCRWELCPVRHVEVRKYNPTGRAEIGMW